MKKRTAVYLLISFSILAAFSLNYFTVFTDGTLYRKWMQKPERPSFYVNENALKEQRIEMLEMQMAQMKLDNENLNLMDELRAQIKSLQSENFKLRNNLYNTTIPITRTQPLLEGGYYTVVDETSYETGPWLASPGLLRMHNGTLLACYDATTPTVSTRIAASHDGGKTWEQTSIIEWMRWPNLVEINNQVYIVGVVSSIGHGVKVLKMKSLYSWSKPVRILDELPTVHTGNVGIVVADDRLHLLVQKGRRNNWTMVYVNIHSNLMNKKNWHISSNLHEPMVDHFHEMKALMGIEESAHSQEAVLVPWGGGLVGIARVSDSSVCSMAALMFWNLEKKELSFMRFAFIPGLGVAKPAVVYDPVSQLYWMLSNYNREISRDISHTTLGYITRSFERCLIDRSILGLFYARQPMDQWHLAGFVSYSPDWAHHSTYPSMVIEGDDLIAVARSHLDTPLNETTVNHGKVLEEEANLNLDVDATANNHNANKITFHRIRNFRQLVHPMMYYDSIV